jgi:hypothetical protein
MDFNVECYPTRSLLCKVSTIYPSEMHSIARTDGIRATAAKETCRTCLDEMACPFHITTLPAVESLDET